MKIIAVYPGRFQPFHKGHAQVYKWLKEKFGNAHIATSDKVEAPKSPFNFDEKKKMMELAGVSPSDIYQVRNPYIAPEVLRHYDGTKTVLVFAVSEKDMAEDPRFSFKPTKSGKPGYLQPYPKDGKGLEPFGDPDKPRGYVVTTPTFTFNVLGEPAKSATEVRKQFANADHETQKKLIKDLFGKYDAKVHKLMDEKIKGALNAAPKPKSIKQIKEETNDNESGRPIVDPNEPNTPMGKFVRKYTPVGDVEDVVKGVQQGDVKRAASGAVSLGAQAATGAVGTAAKIAVGAARGAGIMNEDSDQLDHEKFGPMLDTFVQFASKKLGIQSLPQISLQKGEMQTSFGGYSPQNKSIVVITKNRHPMDVYRTVAHELVHHKQNEDGNLGKDIAAEGSTGSPIENEANSKAGVIMRWFAKKNPDAFKSGQIVESVIEEGLQDPSRQKAVFLAGGPGSGKDFIMNRTLKGHGMREINSDNALEILMDKEGLSKKMPPEERTARDVVRGRAKKITKEKERNSIANRQGLIINGTADDPEKTMRIKKQLEDSGYQTMMVYVNTSNDVSRERNIQRGKEGGREVPEDIRQQKWQATQDAREPLKKAFGDENFIHVDNTDDYRTVHPDRKKEIDKEHAKIFKKVRKFSASTPQDASWEEQEKKKRGITKFTPPRAQKQSVRPNKPQPEYVPNPSELEQAKRLGVQHLGGGQFGGAKGAEPTHVSNGGRLTTLAEERMKGKDPCWKGYQMVGKKKKAGKEVPNCVPVDEDFESFINEGKKKKIKLKKKLNQEDNSLALGYEFGNNGIGDEFGVVRSPNGLGMGYSLPMGGVSSMAESVQKWMNDDRTKARFEKKYGGLAELRLMEAANNLNNSLSSDAKSGPKFFSNIRENWEALGGRDSGTVAKQGKDELDEVADDSNDMADQIAKKLDQLRSNAKPNEKPEDIPDIIGRMKINKAMDTFKAGLKDVKEGVAVSSPVGKAWDKMPDTKDPVDLDPKMNRDPDMMQHYRDNPPAQKAKVDEASPAWQRSAGKNPEGGLNKKGISSYRAEHPGSKLSLAVTEKPSELKAGSKKAKRRLSFCRRMKGMKAKLTSAKTAHDPDSRINKSLRKWNCEE